MKKILGMLALAGALLYGGTAYATSAAVQSKTIETSRTYGKSVLLFNAFQMQAAGTEYFVGSTTNYNADDGAIELTSYPGIKYIGLYGSPTTAGSITVKVYGMFGTDTVPTSGTASMMLLRDPFVFASAVATSTVLSVDLDPRILCVSAICTSGTMTMTIGVDTLNQKP